MRRARRSMMTPNEMAVFYHAWGFNVIPIGEDKRPVIVGSYMKDGVEHDKRYFWQQWTRNRQTMKDMDYMPWDKAHGVAGICGVGNMLCIDFDHSTYRPVNTVLYSLGLGKNYRWVAKTPGGGYHIWVKVSGEMPGRMDLDGIGADHIELRYSGHFAVLPWSPHPDGGTYEFVGKTPISPPELVTASRLHDAYSKVTIAVKEKTTSTGPLPAINSRGAYAEAALKNEMQTLALARQGRRNDTLNTCAFNLGQLILTGDLDENDVIYGLTRVALGIGLGEAEITKTIKSGIKNGRQRVRLERHVRGNDRTGYRGYEEG